MYFENLKFDENGLIPAVVTECGTNKLLMVAYMNEESLEKTIKDKLVCFYSRSRQTLWTKGETSGNFLHLVKIVSDCDNDTLQVIVRKDGPACHTGNETCFFNDLFYNEEEGDFSLSALMDLIKERKTVMKEGSYTSYLFEKGIDKILKKVGEESTEVIIAGKAGDRRETIYEIADLCYHIMVLMIEMNIDVSDIFNELKSRHVIDHKVKQEKMV